MMGHGSIMHPRGAVNIIGPTWNTHTTYNNWFDRGIYRGYVYWDMYRAGQMMNYGKLYMQDYFPEPQHEEFIDVQFRTYLIFGTTDLWVRTGIPTQAFTGLAYASNSMDRYIAVRDGFGNITNAATVSWETNQEHRVYPTDEYGGVHIDPVQAGDYVHIVAAGKNLIPIQKYLPWSGPGNNGSLKITEIKPDISTAENEGDMVEIYNDDSVAIDLCGWILSDLDGYDTPFVDNEAVLQPQQLAVIIFAGPQSGQQIISMPYGLEITSREIPDFSSLEDVAVLRNPSGQIVDSLAWHDNSGVGSTNVAGDLSRLTAPTTPFGIISGGWWNGPDTITQENYEQYSIDWSPFAGNGGDGSIQRSWTALPDGKGNFTVQSAEGFGWFQNTDTS